MKTSIRTARRLFLPAGLAAALFLVGCGHEDTASPEGTDPAASADCGGKCDSPENAVRLLSSLSIVNYESEAGETESFRMVGEVAEAYYFDVEDEHPLKAEIWASDGASNPEFTIPVELVYAQDGAGAFVSETVDTSELLPWLQLSIRITGDFGEDPVYQTFQVDPATLEAVELIEEPADPFAEALDVDAPVIYLDPELPAPDYSYPDTESPFVLSGTEFWQKWPGGHNPTYSYREGTEAGRKCMYASALRFEAIMADPPEALVELEETTNWRGRFFNWNDDFSHEEANGRAQGGVLWAWRTSLIKWISQTGTDGACHLPTRDIVDRAARNCLSRGEASDGEIEGCQAY